MKREKEKIIFKDEDEINLYIMYYASYISKLRAFRNEKDIILKKRNTIFKNRDTSLAACLKIAKKYVEWYCTKEIDLLNISLEDFQTLSFEEIRKKYYGSI